jgi:hypothetical protein
MSDIYLSLTETPAVVTLSQPVISGALSSTVTVANTVTVALDANSLSALEQVTVTVGAAVSVSNFPATQTVAGTVTANVGGIVSGVTIPVRLFAEAEGGASSGQDTLILCDSQGQLLINAKSAGSSVLGYDGNAFVQVKQVSGSSVTIGSLPAIAGTVTASLADVVSDDAFHGVPHVRVNGGNGIGVELAGIDFSGSQLPIWEGGGIPVFPRDDSSLNAPFPVAGTVTVGNTVTVAGTVTANPTGTQTVAGTVTASLSVATEEMQATEAGVRLLLQQDYQAEYQAGQKPYGVPIAFIDSDSSQNQPQYEVVGNYGALFPTAVKNSVTVGNLPRGALTTRFGSVVTAGTAQLTSAVTNASRKYLLLQNISTGAVTVGVGFVPTTTQGIALAAGAGLTFDAFCPTGAVHWLGGTAGAPFTILEG